MEIAQVQKNSEAESPTRSNWSDNPCVQELLDVVACIIAEEYIQIARQNPEIFANNGGNK